MFCLAWQVKLDFRGSSSAHSIINTNKQMSRNLRNSSKQGGKRTVISEEPSDGLESSDEEPVVPPKKPRTDQAPAPSLVTFATMVHQAPVSNGPTSSQVTRSSFQ